MTEPSTRFDLRRSRTLGIWLTAVHAGGILAACASALPAGVEGGLSILAAVSFVRGLRLHALRCARSSVVRLALDPEILLGFPDGRTCRARLRARPFVRPWLVTLRLQSEHGRRIVLVPPDSLPSRAEHKRMRGRLRHEGRP